MTLSRPLSVCLLMWWLGWGGAEAAVYTVAPGGNDAAAGTAEAPFATLQRAAAMMEPGDTVIVRSGRYTLGPGGLVTTRSGRPGAPLTFRADTPGRAILTVATEVTGWVRRPDQSHTAACSPQPAFVIQGDDPLVPAPGDQPLRAGQWRWAGGQLSVRLWDDASPGRQTVRAGGGDIIRLAEGASYQVWEGFRLEYGGCGWNAEAAGSRHNTLRDCILWGLGQGASGGEGTLMEHNYCHSIGAGQDGHGLQVTGPGAMVRYNRCDRVAGSGIWLGPGARGVVVMANELQDPRERRRADSGGAIALQAGGEGHHKISRNLIIGPHRVAVQLDSPGNLLAYNTLVGTLQAGVVVNEGQADNHLVGNVIGGRAALVQALAPLLADYNLYLGHPQWVWQGREAGALAAWQQLSGQETHSTWQVQSPFADVERRNFAPAPGKGLVDRGVVCEGITEGFVGAAPDLGAYEHNGPPRPCTGPRLQ